ncbi:MAG: hypothetical protein HPY60_11125 [Candidatus Methanofastidiosum sp.]|nr:hypothetical protein [Methanofastidiosum sp.]
MRKHIKLILLTLISLFIGCKQYTIDKKTIDWIAYRPGQVYLFQDNEGNIDTLKILKTEKFNNPEDHLAIITPHHEKIVIEASVPDKWTNPMGITFYSSRQSLIEIDANKSSTTFNIIYKPHDYYFASKNIELDEIDFLTKKIGDKTYDDIMIFQCNDESFCSEENSIKEIFWSANYGIVEYNLGNTKYTLKEKLK